MENSSKSKVQFSRRKFLGLTAAAAAFSIVPANIGFAGESMLQKRKKPDSGFGGVKVGAITYSWRSMPSSAEDILNYCIQTGISSIELMGDVAEKYAGLPQSPPRPAAGTVLSESDLAAFEKASKEAKEAQLKWRVAAPMTKFIELRKMYNKAGVTIHIAKYSPENWTDKEIDYSFMAGFMISGELSFLVADFTGFAFSAPADFVAGLFHIDHNCRFTVVSGGQQRGFVAEVGQVGAAESGRGAGDQIKVHVRCGFDILNVHVKYFAAAFDIRQVEHDLAVETAGAQQRRIKHVRTVGGGNDDYSSLGFEAVHFNQHRIERLFTFIVSAAKP